MNLQPVIQLNEEYRCSKCEIKFSYSDFGQDWRCPICRNIINIKVKIDNHFHSCQRLNPDKLKVGDLVTLENKHIYEILNIEILEYNCKIALKEYRVIDIEMDSIVTKINGGW